MFELSEVPAPYLHRRIAILGSVARPDLRDARRLIVVELHLVLRIREVPSQGYGEWDTLFKINFWTVFALNASIALLI